MKAFIHETEIIDRYKI